MLSMKKNEETKGTSGTEPSSSGSSTNVNGTKSAAKVRTTYVFTGNLPKPNLSLRTMLTHISKTYLIEGGDFAIKHKMLVLLSLGMIILSMIPVVNLLVIVGMFFLWPLCCAIAMGMLRNPPLEWFDKAAIKLPESWDLKETIILGVSAIFGVITASVLMSIFMGLMVYIVMSKIGILSIILLLVALAGLFGSMFLLLPLFGCFVLAVPLVFFHKQSAMDSLSLAFKAQRNNIKATMIAYTGLSVVQGALMLLSILMSVFFGVLGLLLIPLFAYFAVVQLDFYLWMYKNFLLEKRTVKIEQAQ